MVYPDNDILFTNKRNKVLIHVLRGIDLESIALSKRGQSQKTTYGVLYVFIYVKYPGEANPLRKKVD